VEQQRANASASSPTGAHAQQRIALLNGALARYQVELTSLLQPLNVGEALAKETHLALRTRLPAHHGILSYAQNIHRDWCWGNKENQLTLDHLADAWQQTAGDSTPENVLVLGCGAGRLAYDLHRRLAPTQTWALDSNPLLCLLGQRMANGERIELTEFPLAPISISDSAVPRTLAAPQPVSGLHFVCADALRLPFAAGQFDLVVTPWLLDVIDASVPTVLQVIAHALQPGGRWLNQGSVAFTGALPANRLTAPELRELTEEFGFNVEYAEDVALPYLQSPASRQQRTEITYTQIATRGEKASGGLQNNTFNRHQHLPDWIVIGQTPVPLTAGFQTQITTTRVHAFIMSLIDGKRSVLEIAQVLEEQRLMPADQAATAIRLFLSTMHEEAVALQGTAAGLAD
jgi:SAM-dependent methyltransferase